MFLRSVGRNSRVSAVKASTGAKIILEEIEVEIRKEINTEKGTRLLTLLMGMVRTTLTPTSAPEGRDSVVVSEKHPTMN